MAEADVEEFGVLAQFVVADNVEYLDATGYGGADEEFVSFGCEFDALTSTLGVECVKQTGRIGGDVEHADSIVGDVQRGGDGHLTIGMKGKALRAIRDLFNHRIDDGFFQGQISDQNVGVVDAVSERPLAD